MLSCSSNTIWFNGVLTPIADKAGLRVIIAPFENGMCILIYSSVVKKSKRKYLCLFKALCYHGYSMRIGSKISINLSSLQMKWNHQIVYD